MNLRLALSVDCGMGVAKLLHSSSCQWSAISLSHFYLFMPKWLDTETIRPLCNNVAPKPSACLVLCTQERTPHALQLLLLAFLHKSARLSRKQIAHGSLACAGSGIQKDGDHYTNCTLRHRQLCTCRLKPAEFANVHVDNLHSAHLLKMVVVGNSEGSDAMTPLV
eukprot:5735346-Amphidinium_carterae.1